MQIPLRLDNNVTTKNYDEINQFDSQIISASGELIASFPTATYRSCEGIVQISQNNQYKLFKFLATHDDSNIVFQEFATINTASPAFSHSLTAVIEDVEALFYLQVDDYDLYDTTVVTKLNKVVL
jgi:hypothetical protein